MRVTEIAKELGFSPDFLRRKEKAGVIPPAHRDMNGHRRYREEDIKAIRNILLRDPSDRSRQFTR